MPWARYADPRGTAGKLVVCEESGSVHEFFVAFVMRGAVSHWYASRNIYLRVIHYGPHTGGVAHAYST